MMLDYDSGLLRGQFSKVSFFVAIGTAFWYKTQLFFWQDRSNSQVEVPNVVFHQIIRAL